MNYRIGNRTCIANILISLLMMIFLIRGTDSLPCRTSNNHICIFPFEYRGTVYTKCTFDEIEDTNWKQRHPKQRRPWCAYEVNEEDNNEMEKWDFCNEHCSVKSIPSWIIVLAVGVLVGIGFISCIADYGGYMNSCRKLIISKLSGRRRAQIT